jgi:hypothetical protein
VGAVGFSFSFRARDDGSLTGETKRRAAITQGQRRPKWTPHAPGDFFCCTLPLAQDDL